MSKFSRRNVLFSSAAGLIGAAFARKSAAAPQPHSSHNNGLLPPARGRGRAPVTVPNGTKLPWKMEGGVKVFHLIAEPVKREFAPGLIVNCFGYNGVTPGPG